MLALLALRHDRTVERSWLAGVLWPDSTEERALAALRTTLKDLRRALGQESWRLSSPSSRTLKLDTRGGKVDVLDFDRAFEDGNYRLAADLYAGELLEGCGEHWIVEERAQREVRAVAAFERRAAALLNEGDSAGAESHLRRALTLWPLHEPVVRLLLEALASSGQSAATVQEYKRFRRRLAREISSQPEAETIALYRKLRRHRVEPQAVPQFAPPPREYRRPHPITRLIGRDAEVAAIGARTRVHRLTTLIGPGGIGKTRLALATADSLAAQFSWGACAVNLATTVDPTRLAETILQSLGVQVWSRSNPVGSLLGATARSDLLLVLDNCEHILDSCSKLVGQLLENCASLRVLATSREPLGIVGEVRWKVPPLALEPSAGESGEHCAAIELFLERAEQACGRFDPNAGDLRRIGRICAMVDGLPLAIEMAAARTAAMSLEEIERGLGDRFALLVEGDRAGTPRQQTLEATLDWSYHLLTDQEQALLRQMSAFAADMTSEAIFSVCQGDGLDPTSVHVALGALTRKSLVEQCPRDTTDSFRLFETVRAYARIRLADSGESSLVSDRHLDYFASVAGEIGRRLFAADQAEWLRRLEFEIEDHLAAADWGMSAAFNAASQDRLDEAIRLGGKALSVTATLTRFWHRTGQVDRALDYGGRALVLGETLARSCHAQGAPYSEHVRRLVAIVRRINGYVLEQAGRPNEALLNLEASLNEALQLGDRFEESASHYGLGLVYHDIGDLAQMRAHLEASLKIGEELGNLYLQSCAHVWLGRLAWLRSDFDKSEGHHSLGYQIAVEDANEARTSAAAMWLALHANRRGDHLAAVRLVQEGLRGNLRSGYTVTFAFGLEAASAAFAGLEAWPVAARLLGAADALAPTISRVPNTTAGQRREVERKARKALGSAEFERLRLQGMAYTAHEALAVVADGL